MRDALPTFQLSRGSVQVQTPPKLSDVASSTAQTAGSAVSVWTNAVDTSPGGITKPFQVMPCPAVQTISAQAIVEQINFGNFQPRANPELVKAWIANVASAQARRAESEMLRQIDTASLAVTTTQILGATADFATYLSQASAAIRSRNRMPRDARLRALVPVWLVDFIAADLAHVHAGDGLERFQVGEAWVRGIFASRSVNVTFYEDTAATGAQTQQLFVPQAAGDLQNFPPTPGVTNSRVIWYLFVEGSWSFGDGGTLDLGLVRDSTLNSTNDVMLFAESFEAAIPKIIESQKITSTLCMTGAGASDVASSGYCTSS